VSLFKNETLDVFCMFVPSLPPPPPPTPCQEIAGKYSRLLVINRGG
jgi:hypothetical protein